MMKKSFIFLTTAMLMSTSLVQAGWNKTPDEFFEDWQKKDGTSSILQKWESKINEQTKDMRNHSLVDSLFNAFYELKDVVEFYCWDRKTLQNFEKEKEVELKFYEESLREEENEDTRRKLLLEKKETEEYWEKEDNDCRLNVQEGYRKVTQAETDYKQAFRKFKEAMGLTEQMQKTAHNRQSVDDLIQSVLMPGNPIFETRARILREYGENGLDDTTVWNNLDTLVNTVREYDYIWKNVQAFEKEEASHIGRFEKPKEGEEMYDELLQIWDTTENAFVEVLQEKEPDLYNAYMKLDKLKRKVGNYETNFIKAFQETKKTVDLKAKMVLTALEKKSIDELVQSFSFSRYSNPIFDTREPIIQYGEEGDQQNLSELKNALREYLEVLDNLDTYQQNYDEWKGELEGLRFDCPEENSERFKEWKEIEEKYQNFLVEAPKWYEEHTKKAKQLKQNIEDLEGAVVTALQRIQEEYPKKPWLTKKEVISFSFFDDDSEPWDNYSWSLDRVFRKGERAEMGSLHLIHTGYPEEVRRDDWGITVTTKEDALASYQLESNRIDVESGQLLRAPYSITVQPGGKVSLGFLNTARTGWYGKEEPFFNAGTDPKIFEGVYERVVPKGETLTSLVFRNYHLMNNGGAGQSTFTIEELDLGVKESLTRQLHRSDITDLFPQVPLIHTGNPQSVEEKEGKITVTTKNNALAEYQLRSERISVEEGQEIRVPYEITVEPGGKVSMGYLNTKGNGWYGPEEKLFNPGNTPQTFSGVYVREVPKGETQTSLVFRNYHLGTAGQSTFTIGDLDFEAE